MHLNEVPMPKPKPNELLVKVACASLCHSDIMMFEPNDQGLILGQGPVTLGHEATGFVVQAGDETTGFKKGDPVGFIPAIDCCYECEPCKIHNVWCVTGNQKMQGFSRDGYFQEYVCVDYRSSIVLPSELDPTESAPLFCAGLTAFHGIDDLQLPAGKWIAVIGCGGLGHMGIQYAKAMGLNVIGLDISEMQLEEAKAQGADHVFNSMTDKDYVQKIKDITKGGVDAAVNFTASKRSYDDAVPIIRKGTGILMVVGIPQQQLTFNAMDLALGRFRLMGSSNGTRENIKKAVDFSAKHGIKAHVTWHKLEQLPEMVEQMSSGKFRGRLGVKFE